MWRRIRQALNSPGQTGPAAQAPAEAAPEPRPGPAPGLRHAGGRAAPAGVTRFSVCRNPGCTRGAAALAAAVRREAERLGLIIQIENTLTVCDGACQSGPFLGMPERGLFYNRLGLTEVRRMLLETSLAGRLLHHRLYLDPTIVTDSRVIYEYRENLIVAMEAGYCLVGLVAYLFRFNAAESCGKCFPCRLGVHELDRLLAKLMDGRAGKDDLKALEDLAQALALASYCQFGHRVTHALRLALAGARQEFERHLAPGGCRGGELFIEGGPAPGAGQGMAAWPAS